MIALPTILKKLSYDKSLFPNAEISKTMLDFHLSAVEYFNRYANEKSEPNMDEWKDVLNLYETENAHYPYDVNISEREHGVESAIHAIYLTDYFNFPSEKKRNIILGCLFHDVGRLLITNRKKGHHLHDIMAYYYLMTISKDIAKIALLHGYAKYQLIKMVPEYADFLSPESKESLSIQKNEHRYSSLPFNEYKKNRDDVSISIILRIFTDDAAKFKMNDIVSPREIVKKV